MSFRPLVSARGPVTSGRAALCLPLLARSGPELLVEAQQAIRQRPDLLEWRVDALQDLGAAIEAGAEREALIALAAHLRDCLGRSPVILTLRAAAEGGHTAGLSDAARVGLLLALAPALRPEFIDIELATRADDLAQLRQYCRQSDVRLIISSHDFTATPDETALLATFGAAARLGADVAKIAVTPRSFADVLRLMQVTQQAAQQAAQQMRQPMTPPATGAESSVAIVGISMGSLGLASRVFATEIGSAMTFVAGAQASAPGQLDIAAFREILSLLGQQTDQTRDAR